MFSKKQLLICLFLLSLGTIYSQEQLGIRMDNYSGINGTILNPSAHVSTPFAWDVNLIEGSHFMENNYTYLRQTRLFDLFKQAEDIDIVAAPDIDDENNMPAEVIVLDYYNDGRKRFANSTTNFMGPSFYVRLGERHTIGLYTRARFAANTRGVSDNFSYYQYFDQKFFDGFTIDPFRMNVLGWSEVALNYLHTIPTANGKIGLGISLKHLQGYEAVYLENEQSFELTKLPGDSLSGSPIDFQYGFTTTNFINNDVNPQQNGRGFAFDLGFTYLVSEFEEGYKWKFGAALLDIGSIRFNKNTQLHQVQTEGQTVIGTEIYQDFKNLTQFEDKIRVFSEQTLDDPDASLVDNEFSIWLPSALSLQIDHAFTPNLYLGGAIVAGLPLGKIRASRGTMVALSPRFEHRWFTASMPVSVYNWNKTYVGLAVRLGFITLGTDNLGSMVSRSDFSGTDFYFAVKVNPFFLGGKNKKFGGKSGKRRFGNKKGPRCYEF